MKMEVVTGIEKAAVKCVAKVLGMVMELGMVKAMEIIMVRMMVASSATLLQKKIKFYLATYNLTPFDSY